MSAAISGLRIGQGYDLHRLVPDKPLFLTGVEVISPLGVKAHSDGDVVLHALIDALLGAAAMGDIGEHFPPSNPQFKDADSKQLLSEVLKKLEPTGLKPINVDVTIFLEKPKLSRYKDTFKLQIADLLGIAMDCVNVKAKTNEGLDAIGRCEAIAASVTILMGA